jgi:hypothetical protein
MLWRLGAVALLCAALVACAPALGGRVVAGLDDDGHLVAMLGVCDEGKHVELIVYTPLGTVPNSPHGNTFGEAERDDSTVGMRVELRPDQAPDGWSSTYWALPDHGTVDVFFKTVQDDGVSHTESESSTIDLAAAPPLPDDAKELALDIC